MSSVSSEHKKRLAEMAEEIVNPLDAVERFLGMIYGPKGTGKTVMAIGMAQQLLKDDTRKKIVHVDTSKGYVSLRNHPALAENVITVPYKGYQYLETIIYAIKHNAPPFDNVGAMVWDEMSTMAQRDLEFVYKARAKSDSPEWPDYSVATNRVRELMTFHFNMNPDVHLIMTSHEKDKKNKDGAVIFTYPSITPASNEAIGQVIHVVGRLTAKTTKQPDGTAKYERTIQVHPTARVEAKTRIGGLAVSVTPKVFINRAIEWLKNAEPVEEEPQVTEDVDNDVDLTKLAELADSIGEDGGSDDVPSFE